MAPRSVYSDNDIAELSQRFGQAAKEDLFRTVRCCVIGARATRKWIVNVPVHPGFEDAPRSVDLYIDHYVDHCPADLRLPKSLGINSACIRKFPPSLRRNQRFQWSIFYEDQLTTFNPPLPRNRLYDSFKCEDGRRNHYGNIAVVKADREGIVVNVEEEDLYFIEVLVYSYLEEISQRSRFPVLSRPMLQRNKEKTEWLLLTQSLAIGSA